MRSARDPLDIVGHPSVHGVASKEEALHADDDHHVRHQRGGERSLYAFLAEKERRSGSRRTVEGYSGMLQHFFGTIGKPPDRVTSEEVFAWGYGIGLSGKQPSSVTIGARIACLCLVSR